MEATEGHNDPLWRLKPNYHRPTEVRPGLFLGGLLSLAFVTELGLTHVLSIVEGSVAGNPGDELSVVHHMQISLVDMETSDILSHLPACVDFINSGLQSGGRVLVHCMAGVSRSATAVAAYLMASEGLGSEEAVTALREVHARTNPNHGFVQQLALFAAMKNRLDEGNWEYRQRRTLQQWKKGGVAVHDLPDPSASKDTLEATMYRCRKCRRMVATSLNVAPDQLHVNIVDRFQFGKRPSRHSTGSEPVEGSLFVEPLRWMEEASYCVSGKLYCPGCSARLGSFNWAGMQNSQGSWITPAFQLHLDRLDAEPPLSEAPVLNIRRPALR